ncbi:MAG: sporulation transcriptional regulator SpoIIID [Firmicutes bacterium]|nr:sporulation transcriptional regulator SpoIIID [Bacillota bacterium]
MKQHIKNRAHMLADYILETRHTVREASKKFNVSKSTVHKDVTQRLRVVDNEKYERVKEILEHNLSVRHIRGGEMTRLKYENMI